MSGSRYNYQGYYRFPTMHLEKICFVSEDDLWLYESSSSSPLRLTTGEFTALHCYTVI